MSSDDEVRLLFSERVLHYELMSLRAALSDEYAATMHEEQLRWWRNEMLAQMVFELRGYVLSEHLEPETQRVTFEREMPIATSEHLRYMLYAPQSRWDAIKQYVLPRWLARRLKRWKLQPVQVDWGRRTRVIPDKITHVIDEDVVIERKMLYPHASEYTALPPTRYGPPVYREARRTTW